MCRDLRSLGGLGFPKEYLTGLDVNARRGPVSEKDVLERLAQGCEDEAAGVAATKIMVAQAGFTYEALAGRPAEDLTDALSGVISWARKRYDRVLLVFLVRNAIDQAISRAVAQKTGIYHSTDRAYREAGGAPPPVDNMNQLILDRLHRVVRERDVVLEAHKAHADLGLMVTYDELTRQVGEWTARVVARAQAAGFQVQNDTVTRKLQRIITPERSNKIREDFLEYLRTETGAVPEHLVPPACP
jgi:LPS sulfotransferase NodH